MQWFGRLEFCHSDLLLAFDRARESRFLTASPFGMTREPYKRNGGLDRYCDVFDDFSQYLIGLFGFFQRRGVEAVDDDTMGEDGNDERLDVFGSAVGAAFQKCHGLRGAVESLRSTGRDTQREEFRLPRRANDFEGVRHQ